MTNELLIVPTIVLSIVIGNLNKLIILLLNCG
nr:MAG TPA: Protein of unknown function (DUF2897) [Caudoviricetes sp.]